MGDPAAQNDRSVQQAPLGHCYRSGVDDVEIARVLRQKVTRTGDFDRGHHVIAAQEGFHDQLIAWHVALHVCHHAMD